MCNPMLLLAGAGAVVQGIGAVRQLQTASFNQRVQGDAAKRDAALRREAGAYEGARAMERGRQLIGRQVATYAGKGISPATGSPLDVVTSTGADVSLDIAASRYGTRRAIENDETRAKVAYRNSQDTLSAAPLAFISPILSASTTYLQSQYARWR